MTFPWKESCHTVELWGYDPDNDAIDFEILTQPQNGFITSDFIGFSGENLASSPAPSGPRALLDPAADCSPRNHGIQACFPNCTDALCPDCWVGSGTSNFPPSFGASPLGIICPEGPYFKAFYCYVTFSETFTGTDSFSYRAVDTFGGGSDPVIVTITVAET